MRDVALAAAMTPFGAWVRPAAWRGHTARTARIGVGAAERAAVGAQPRRGLGWGAGCSLLPALSSSAF